jgi:pseudomonalisin
VKRRLLAPAAAATTALTALLGLTAVPAGAASSETPTWVTTATQAEPLGGLHVAGPLAAATPLRVDVALRLRDVAGLDHDIATGSTLSPAAFERQFSPTTETVARVESYLRSSGFAEVTVSANRLLVSATGTAGRAEKAFDTTLTALQSAHGSGFANTTAARVPSTIAGSVASVLGLSDLGRMVPTSIRTTRPAAAAGTAAAPATTNPPSSCVLPGVGYPCEYNPQGFWTAYDATHASTGAKTTVAIFAEGDLTQVVKDLRTEEKANGLPQVKVDVVRTGVASTDTSGADEWDLDTQYSTGMAKTVKELIVYDAPTLTDSDLARSFTTFAAEDKAKAASASFGECEYQAYLDGSMLADDEAFAEAASQGQTVFASAGDTGGFCPVAANNGVPAGVPDVNYPASSPYVVSVGGTTLVTNTNGTYDEEIAWFAGGGGVSLFENPPSWQATDGLPGTIAGTICGNQAVIGCGRTVPDVAMDADPNSGANVYVDGTPEGVGGTSLASPLALGVWARIESYRSESVPFASPRLYAAATSGAFHDVTLGDTGPYPATPGYDLATGLGSFDVAKAETAIK